MGCGRAYMLWWWHSDVLLPPNENFVNNSVNSVDKNRHPRGCDDSPIFITPATSLVVCDVFPAFNCFPERPSRRPDAQKHSQGISWIPAHGREKLWAWIGLFFSDPGTGVNHANLAPSRCPPMGRRMVAFPAVATGPKTGGCFEPFEFPMRPHPFVCNFEPHFITACLSPIRFSSVTRSTPIL